MASLEKLSLYALTALLAAGISACEGQRPTTAAPLDDETTLQKLATAYHAVEEQEHLEMPPANLPPEKRKKFVDMVFAQAGYNYAATLDKIATGNANLAEKRIRDMAELLLMPHRNSSIALDEIYSAEEVKDIRALESKMK
ncbi:MAG: hypothetical protein IDH49_11735 [Gammaproteobacteria bacterium]|nr:hypothetical protein [Gammaproteobacteria bacterium]